MSQEHSHSDKFKGPVTDLDCYEDEGRWNEKLRKVAGQKLAPEKWK
jgi:hypothetical protein